MGVTYRKGLEGVVAAETKLSLVDGKKGDFIYRGYWVKDLAVQYTFEEVAYFLWHGHFPNKTDLTRFKQKLNKYRKIPPYVKEIINYLPENMDVMDVLRTAISSLGNSFQWPPKIEDAMRLTAITPAIIAYWYRSRSKQPFIESNDNYDHVANYLFMLNGEKPTYAHWKALTSYMILTMEHGMNASTFSSRVVSSTESDMVSSIVAAIGAMKGPLHGGAPSGVLAMFDEIRTLEDIEPYIMEKLIKGEKLMGFGHRIYKTIDPRSEALKKVAKSLTGEDQWFDLAVQFEEKAIELLNQYKPGRKLYTNVEFYAAAIFKGISLPNHLFTPTFTASRMVGWTAHVLEQASDNRIFRPQSVYTGNMPKT